MHGVKDNICKLEDSNIEKLSGKEHHDAVRSAAAHDAEWKGAGAAVGVEIWRVENHARTEEHAAHFGVKRYAKKSSARSNTNPFGQFLTGDSFIVLRTYKADETKNDLSYDVHFWLGASTSQDEQGTAAYKTVELDELLGGKPVQYREVQGHESERFLQLFGGNIRVLEGGIASGFTHASQEHDLKQAPRLFHFQQVGKKQTNVRMTQVPLAASSLNNEDAFMLDRGDVLYLFKPTDCSMAEQTTAQRVCLEIREERGGRPRYEVVLENDTEDGFWGPLGGKVTVGPKPANAPEQKAYIPKLLRVSDEKGLVPELVDDGKLARHHLRGDHGNNIFLIDQGITVYVYVGLNCSLRERSACMRIATEYLASANLSHGTPLVRIVQGSENAAFWKLFEEA